jgi:hypothetical protein
MDPGILVRHIFNFDFSRSLANAYRRSMIWTMYSLENKDVLRDSGTASLGLKFNVAAYSTCILLAFLYPPAVPAVAALNLLVNRGLIAAFHRAKGAPVALMAGAYYFLVYPLPVGAGALAGLLRYLWEIKLRGRYR